MGVAGAMHPGLDIGAIPAETLRLVPLGAGDAEALRAVTSDPAVTAVIPFLPEPFGLKQAEALLDRQQAGRDLYLGIRARVGEPVPGVPAGTLLGVVGVHLRGQTISRSATGCRGATTAAASPARPCPWRRPPMPGRFRTAG